MTAGTSPTPPAAFGRVPNRRALLRSIGGGVVASAIGPAYAVAGATSVRAAGRRPAAIREMRRSLGFANRYGEYGTRGVLIEPEALEAEIAAHESVPADHVLVSHGATELLQLCPAAFGEPGVAGSVPTYAALFAYAGFGRPLAVAPLLDDHHHDFDRLGALSADGGLVYLCHPNNPTGLVEPQGELEEFCRGV